MDTRRQLFRKLAGALAFGLLALKGKPAFAKKLGLDLSKVPSLKKVGGSAVVKLEGKEVLLIRDAQTSVRGLSARCTHADCLVAYKAQSGKIDCGCHGSEFTLTGAVVKGPAATALHCYNTSLSGDQIIIEVS